MARDHPQQISSHEGIGDRQSDPSGNIPWLGKQRSHNDGRNVSHPSTTKLEDQPSWYHPPKIDLILTRSGSKRKDLSRLGEENGTDSLEQRSTNKDHPGLKPGMTTLMSHQWVVWWRGRWLIHVGFQCESDVSRWFPRKESLLHHWSKIADTGNGMHTDRFLDPHRESLPSVGPWGVLSQHILSHITRCHIENLLAMHHDASISLDKASRDRIIVFDKARILPRYIPFDLSHIPDTLSQSVQ